MNNNNNNATPSEPEHCHLLAGSSRGVTPPPHKICLETSFTSGNNVKTTETNDSSHLPWEFVSLVEPRTEKRNDSLIHDEWFGLAPLATPESFSEVSSISSRTNSVIIARRLGNSRHSDHININSHSNSVTGMRDSHSVRFDETLNTSNEISPEEVSHESNERENKMQNNLFARIFKKKEKKKSRNHSPENTPEEIEPANDLIVTDVPHKADDSATSTESSPLLSSLHLLTDQRFAEILGKSASKENNSISSTSFRSGDSVQELNATISSADSVTINAEVHRSPELFPELQSESPLGGESLLEDIERSLKISLSRAGSSVKLASVSLGGSSPKLTSVEIDLDDQTGHSLGGGNKPYMYPILLVGSGESSV